MKHDCERCCFYEFCVKNNRTETKNCVYGKKNDVVEEQNNE